jgi:hypothetical protein
MVQLVRHRQTKESATDRLHLNHRVTPRLHTITFGNAVTRVARVCEPHQSLQQNLQCLLRNALVSKVLNCSHIGLEPNQKADGSNFLLLLLSPEHFEPVGGSNKGCQPAFRVVHLNRFYTLRFVGTT